MLFVPFPSLPAQERIAHSDVIDTSLLAIAPDEALRAAPSATALRLISRAGRPAYVATDDAGVPTVIDAGTGSILPMLDEPSARAVAQRFAGHAAGSVDPGVTYDQWVVHQGFDDRRPYYRVIIDDAPGTILYVASSTGEVVQRTTESQRRLNWVGAVIHWIYFTPMRKSWSLWNQLVWWVSLLALLGAMTGMVLGIYRFVQARRIRGGGFLLYKRWMRWHHILGIFAGAFLLLWIFSGWLSMDHQRLFSVSAATREQREHFQGNSLKQTVAAMSLPDLKTVASAGATQVRLLAVAGQAFMLTQYRNGGARIHYAGQHTALAVLPNTLLFKAVRAAWPDFSATLDAPSRLDDFYRSAEEVSSDVRRFSISEGSAKYVYVDALSGEIEAVVDRSRRAYAWLYFGLHTYKVPGLADHDRLRIALMLVLLLAGLTLSITGTVLAWKHLSR